MPITGQETELADALASAIKAALTELYGPYKEPEYIQGLCNGIANGLIPFLVSNVQVNTGQSVNVPGEGLIDSINGDVTGDATGTVDTTGTIS